MAVEEVANLDQIEVGETLLVELREPVCLVRVDGRGLDERRNA